MLRWCLPHSVCRYQEVDWDRKTLYSQLIQTFAFALIYHWPYCFGSMATIDSVTRRIEQRKFVAQPATTRIGCHRHHWTRYCLLTWKKAAPHISSWSLKSSSSLIDGLETKSTSSNHHTVYWIFFLVPLVSTCYYHFPHRLRRRLGRGQLWGFSGCHPRHG